MSQLVQVPGGDWVKPESITGIFAFPPMERFHSESEPIGWRVVVHQDGGNAAACLPCLDQEDAELVRDAFAAKVNAALASNVQPEVATA